MNTIFSYESEEFINDERNNLEIFNEKWLNENPGEKIIPRKDSTKFNENTAVTLDPLSIYNTLYEILDNHDKNNSSLLCNTLLSSEYFYTILMQKTNFFISNKKLLRDIAYAIYIFSHNETCDSDINYKIAIDIIKKPLLISSIFFHKNRFLEIFSLQRIIANFFGKYIKTDDEDVWHESIKFVNSICYIIDKSKFNEHIDLKITDNLKKHLSNEESTILNTDKLFINSLEKLLSIRFNYVNLSKKDTSFIKSQLKNLQYS